MAAPPGKTGRGCRGVNRRSGGVTATDKAVALFAFDDGVVEEVGVDRSGETRIVELEAQIVAALIRALGPGGADLDSADEDAVAGCVVVRAILFRDDPYILRLNAEGDDFADVLVGGLLEGSDGGHVSSPFGFRARARRGLDGDRQGRDDRRRSPEDPERMRRTAETEFLVSRGMGVAQGKKVRLRRCGQGGRGVSRYRPDQSMRGRVGRG